MGNSSSAGMSVALSDFMKASAEPVNKAEAPAALSSTPPVGRKQGALPESSSPEGTSDPTVRMLVITLDYARTSYKLTCSTDGQNIANLARQSGAEVHTVLDDEATKENVIGKIRELGPKCKPGDTFCVFYAGHGTQVFDWNNDENDGLDEAFCLVDSYGKTYQSVWLTDDEFASELSSHIRQGVKVLVLADCCHSGTICDLDKPCWRGLDVVSLTGCDDRQTSGDTGKGGVFTHSLLLAVDQLIELGQPLTLEHIHQYSARTCTGVFRRRHQDVTLQYTKSPQMMWPLMPKGRYAAPMRTSMMYREALASATAAAAGNTAPAAAKPEGSALADATHEAPGRTAQTDAPGSMTVTTRPPPVVRGGFCCFSPSRVR